MMKRMRSFSFFLQQLSQSLSHLRSCVEQQKGHLQRLDHRPFADFAHNLLGLVNVIAVDRQASVLRWRRQLM